MGSARRQDERRPDASTAMRSSRAQSIACRVDVGGGGDDKLRALRVELGYRNTYYHRTRLGRTAARTRRARPTTSSSSPSGCRPTIRDDGRLAGFDFALAIPDDVPPSAPEWVDWSVDGDPRPPPRARSPRVGVDHDARAAGRLRGCGRPRRRSATRTSATCGSTSPRARRAPARRCRASCASSPSASSRCAAWPSRSRPHAPRGRHRARARRGAR